MNENSLPTIRHVWTARARISSFVKPTPLKISSELSKKFNASIFLKLEYLHPTGSFKLRGAANKILSLTEEERRRGVATFSTGNHGLAVSYMAQKLNIPVSVFISTRVPQVKVNNLKELGVEVVAYGEGQDEAEQHCCRVAEERGLTVVKPFDDPFVIAGQGTIALELLDQCPQLEAVVIPLSGGGLAGGIALALKSIDNNLATIGVSMQEGAVMYHSLKAGKPVILPETDTLADSLLGGLGMDNKYTFPLVREYVDKALLVSEQSIAQGMADLYKYHRIVVEGASATALSALYEHNIVKPGGNIALILSGNNVDPNAFFTAVQNYL